MPGLSRAEIFGITVFSILAVIWLGQITFSYYSHGSQKPGESAKNENLSKAPSTITIQVAGAVEKPGILNLNTGSRVSDAIERAGGTVLNADTSLLNLAETLTDGQKIYVPFKGETVPASLQKVESKVKTGSDSKSKPINYPVNLNTATMEELNALPGIGEIRAKDIIAYRNQHGGFKKKEEIMNVKGIGEGIYSKIKDLIYI